MRKIIAISSLFVFALFSVNTTFADTGSADGSANEAVQITDTVSGTNLDFNPSPGVSIAWCTSDATYAMTSLNTNAAVADQNEYGVHSGYGGYYQNNTAAADTFGIDVTGIDDSTDIADPFAAWTAMGGSGGAS